MSSTHRVAITGFNVAGDRFLSSGFGGPPALPLPVAEFVNVPISVRVVAFSMIKSFALFLYCVSMSQVLQVDEKLAPGAERLMVLSEPAAENRPFQYLMGMEARAGVDPVERGREITAAYRVHVEKNGKTARFDLDEAGLKGIEPPRGELFCPLHEAGCLETLLGATPGELAAIEHADLIRTRYRAFMAMGPVRTTIEPHLFGVIPPYQVISKGSRLALLDAIVAVDTDGPRAVLDRLRANLDALRRRSRLAYNLIDKMVYAGLMAENIDLMAAVARRYETGPLERLEPLSRQERDFRRVLAHEFRMSRNGILMIHDQKLAPDDHTRMPEWIMDILHKPNATTNLAYSNFNKAIVLAGQDAKVFANRVRNRDDWRGWPPDPFNPLGSILTGVAAPMYTDYIGRYQDLDSKIHLFNRFVVEGVENPDEIVNPYYGETGRGELRDDGRYCLEGPTKDHRDFRCLRLGVAGKSG